MASLKYAMKYFFLFLLLTACGGGSGGGGDGEKETPTTPIDDAKTEEMTVEFEVPVQVRDANKPNARPIVKINGNSVEGFNKVSDLWTRYKTEIIVEEGSNRFEIQWVDTFSNTDITLGNVDINVSVESGTETVRVDQSGFVSSSYDADGDGIPNLNDPNPLEPNSTSEDPTTLELTVTIPEATYAGDIKVTGSWSSFDFGERLQHQGGRVYRGYLDNISPTSGTLRVYVRADGNVVSEYRKENHAVVRGENKISLSESDLALKPVSAKVTASLPDKNYRGSYKVRVKGVNGSSYTDMSGSNRSFSKDFNDLSTGNKTVELEVRNASENYLWASAKKTFTVKAGSSNVFAFSESDFNFSIDNDGDGISNIDDDQPDVPYVEPDPDVYVPYVSTPPVIDGDPSDSAWSADTNEYRWIDKIQVDNRTSDSSNEPDNSYENDPYHRWKAVHDGEYLYIRVFSENDFSAPVDSSEVWEDDAVNIFWDGNNSKGTSYDGVDDYHIIIALLTSDSYANSGTRWQQGSRSADLPTGNDLTFVTSLEGNDVDTYLDIYEIRIKLDKAGIQVNRAFGFDISIDDDDDGGGRDMKWGWYHNRDEVYKNPSKMGTLYLE